MAHINLPIERWRYLVDVGLWPKRATFDPVSWINNFTLEELPYALRLLEGFTFFSQELVSQMFRSTFLNVSQEILTNKENYLTSRMAWSEFIDSLLIVRVTGEIPSDADSGFAFSRMARDVLNIPEEQIVSPEQAIHKLACGHRNNIMFVDDFVGSGNQFCDTWERKYFFGPHEISFAMVAKGARVGFFYCPLICTELGRGAIALRCPEVKIVAAHFYGSKHSALSSDSEIWRQDMRLEGPKFVRTASLRAGIPDLDGQVGCWQGFHKLGLALGFQHNPPDATLPIFYFSQNDWRPLIRKGVV